MLKVIMLRKKQDQLEKREAELRSKLAGFKQREDELAQAIADATEEDTSDIEAAVAELETNQADTKAELKKIRDDLDKVIGEIEDAEKAQALAEKVLEALRNSDERESEAQLVELVGLDHPDLISLLLSNRAKIAYVIRWRQAESEAARHAIAEELLADASLDGVSVLKALEANRSR